MKIPAIAVIIFATLVGLAAGFGLRATGNNPLSADNQGGTGAEKLPAAEKIEALPFYNPSSSDTKTTSESADTRSSGNASANLTEKLAGDFAADFFKRNPDGPTNINDKGTVGVPLETDMEALIADAVFQWNDGQTSEIVIDDKDIILVSDSAESKREYSEKIKSSLNKNFGDEAAAAFAQPQTVENMEKLFGVVAAAYDNIVSEYRKIPVPYSFKNEHKIMLNSLVNQQNLWSAIKNYDEDPLKALIAITNIKMLDDEFSSAYQKITGGF